MAGTMVHMLTAQKIIKNLKAGCIHHEPAFYLGNFAPDAIHVRKDYKREWKMHTHFRDGIADADFSQPENLALFHKRLQEFARSSLSARNPKTPEFDFYQGYVTHMLTDEYFMCTIRPEFMKSIASIGLTQQDAKTFEYFTYDVNQVDFRIAAEEEGMKEIYDKIKTSPAFAVEGLLSLEEIEASRQWVLHMYYDSHPAYSNPVFLDYNRMLEFTTKAADSIIETVKKDYPVLTFAR